MWKVTSGELDSENRLPELVTNHMSLITLPDSDRDEGDGEEDGRHERAEKQAER